MNTGSSRQTSLTRAGVVYCVIAACFLGSAFIQRVNLLVLAFGLMAAPLALSWWWGRGALHWASVRRRLPAEAFVGAPVTIELEIHNSKRRGALAGLVAFDDWVAGEVEVKPWVAFPEIPAGQMRRRGYRTLFHRRGRLHFAGMTVATAAPLGLLECRRVLAGDDVMWVYPRLGSMTNRWREESGWATESSSRRRHEGEKSFDEVHGLRDYRWGDNPRHIHWRTSARRGQPVVKEFETLAARDVVLVLDPAWSTTPTPAERNAVEVLFSFAATAVVDWCDRSGGHSRRLTLAFTGAEPEISRGQTSPRFLRAALRRLAQAQGVAEADLSSCWQQLVPDVRRGAKVWIASTRSGGAGFAAARQFLGTRDASSATWVDVSHGGLTPYFRIEDDQAQPGR